MDNKKIGRYLLKKRKEEQKTQKEIADDLGVTYQAVSRWENGDSIPDIETLCMLADLYHVTVDEILQRQKLNEEKSEMLMLAFMSVFVYIVAILAFVVINTIWLPIIAIALFVIFGLAGMVPANVYFFSELKVKTKKDKIFYALSYVPLIIGILIVVLS